MNAYSLTDEQKALREAARQFAQGYLAPMAAKVEQAGAEFPKEALLEMARNGFLKT